MQIIDSRAVWRLQADSLWEAQNWLASAEYSWRDKAPFRSDAHYGGSWTLGHSFDEVMRLAREGWEDGVCQISEAARAPANNTMKAWRYDMAGEMPDVPRFLGGDPAHMRRRGHENAHRPIVSIFVNNWINGMINAQQMVNYGAAMVAWIDRIEAAGKRVELIVGTVAPQSGGCRENRVLSASWKVKGAQDPLDLSALAFSLAHPGASRRIGWALWGCSQRVEDSGFGCAVHWDVQPEHLIDPHPELLIVRGMCGAGDRARTFEDGVLFAAEQLNAAAAKHGMPPIAELEAL